MNLWGYFNKTSNRCDLFYCKMATYTMKISTASAKRTSKSGIVYSQNKKVQVGKDQEKAQSEKDSHSKNRGGIMYFMIDLH